ncbi:MAG: hypothetical protein LBF63_01775 [Treponema sp.]|jgi:hypothetical protein|nr:hypothetical protein [Treponema sp.]
MRHATLLEAFQDVSGLAQQGLEIFSRERKYHLDTKLFEAANELERIQDELALALTDIDGDGENPYQSNPDEYKKHADKTLAAWRDRAENAGNGSRYYTDQLKQIAARGETAMARKTLEARAVFNRKQAAADLEKNLTAAWNAPEYDTWEKKLDAQLAIYRGAVNNNLLDPVQAAEVEKSIYNRVFQYRIALEDDGERSVAEAERLIREAAEGERKGEFAKFVDDIPGKIGAAADAARVQIENRNLKKLQARNEAYEREARDAIATNDIAAIMAAQILQKEGAEERDRALASGEYNRAHDPQIAAMFRKFPELEPGRPQGSVSVDDAVNEAAARFLDQVVWNNNVDSTGAGLDSSGNPLSYGNTLSELYMSLEKAYGGKESPGVLRAKLDNKILDILRDNSDIREGKIILDQLRQMTDAEDVEEFKKLTGLTDENIRQGLMNRVLDAYARYRRNRDSPPEEAKAARDLLNFELAQAKNAYSAGIMKPVLDRAKDSKSSLTDNITTGDLAKTLAFMNEHPELVKRGRDGSVSLESHYDDTVRAAMAQAKRILEAVPGISTATLPEGAAVIGKDEAGNRYRLTGNGNFIQLQQEINGEWKPIAQRKYANTDVNEWAEFDAVKGEVVMRRGKGGNERYWEPKEFPGVNGAAGKQEKTPEEEIRERVQPPPGSNQPRGTRRREEEERRRREGR